MMTPQLGRARLVRIALHVTLVATSVAPIAGAAAIEWRVADRFPLLQGLAPDEAAKWLVADSGSEPFDAWYRRVSSAGASPFASIRRQDGAWDDVRHAYRPDFLRRYVHSRTMDVLLSVAGGADRCSWQIDGQPWVEGGCAEQRVSISKDGAVVRVRGRGVAPATETIVPERLVVLGLGDSYASGEGNPDRPTAWKRFAPLPGDLHWVRSHIPYVARVARWWAHECHRSFWSHQTYTSLRLASESPHRQVVFLHHACSGAEIFDGVLVRQADPPGRAIACPDARRGAKCRVEQSQLRAAVDDLCPVAADAPDMRDARIREVTGKMEQLQGEPRMASYRSARRNRAIDLRICPRGLVRPDLVLLSIGGNDIGFAGLVAWAVLPANFRNKVLDELWTRFIRGSSVVCPRAFPGGSKGCKTFDDDLLRSLAKKLVVLVEALDVTLEVPRHRVVLTAYPDPIRTGDRDPAKAYMHDPPGSHRDGPWEAARALGPLGSRPELNIVESEAKTLAESSIPRLREVQRDVAGKAGWTFAAEAADAFVGRGWRSHMGGDPPIRLPSVRGDPWNATECSDGERGPACWRPLAPMSRYVRTLNDSMLTQNSDRKDDHTGTVHPTAQGQAAVAEAVHAAARAALDRPR